MLQVVLWLFVNLGAESVTLNLFGAYTILLEFMRLTVWGATRTFVKNLQWNPGLIPEAVGAP